MKYYIYSFNWRANGHSTINAGRGRGEFRDIVELYEHVAAQPENICITHVAEITEEQYNRVKENGIIG